MADSNVPSLNEKQEVETGNKPTPPFNKEQVKTAENDVLSANEKQKIIAAATSEMEYRVELFNRLTHTCFNKCVDKRYKDNELNTGESTCIDRCVSKYYQVNNMIGQILASGASGRRAV